MNKINNKKYKHYWKLILPIGLGASFLIAFTVEGNRTLNELYNSEELV